MKMQDEEFDQAFNSKFDDFEVEPSPMVWKGIADELDGKRSKRSLVAYLSIAASVIVLLAAGALFFRQQEKPTKPHADPNKLAATQPTVTVSPKSVTEPAITESSTKRVASTIKQTTTSNAPAAINAGILPTEKAENTPREAEPVKRDNPQLIAAVAAPAHDLLQPVVSGKEVALAMKSPEIDKQTAVAHPAIIASVPKPDATPTKKRGIHSLGGLINVLVAKVDKRQDKLIEFTDDDDDDAESNVTGVNLGIIKIKKQ